MKLLTLALTTLLLTGCQTLPFWDDGKPGISAHDVVLNGIYIIGVGYAGYATIEMIQDGRERDR